MTGNAKKLELMFEGRVVEIIESGGFFGEESVVRGFETNISLRALEDTELYALPSSILGDIPIIRWKLLESQEHRRPYAIYLRDARD